MCELDSSFFVVWTPEEVHTEEIKRDETVSRDCLDKVDALVLHAILAEIIGCWFTKPRLSSAQGRQGAEMVSASGRSEGPYCICKGQDDGSKMICCDSGNCKSGQWFHYRCVKITRAPRFLMVVYGLC